MNFFNRILLLFTVVLIVTSCSSKKMLYVHNSDLTEFEITEDYDLRIKKDDQLSIIVNSKEIGRAHV